MAPAKSATSSESCGMHTHTTSFSLKCGCGVSGAGAKTRATSGRFSAASGSRAELMTSETNLRFSPLNACARRSLSAASSFIASGFLR
jgi:hypothetical protein